MDPRGWLTETFTGWIELSRMHTRVSTRALLYGVQKYFEAEPITDEDKYKCLKFTVLIHENVSPVLHAQCNLSSLKDTWNNLRRVEPDAWEAEADILLKAFRTELRCTDVDEFIKIHTEAQAQLYRLSKEVHTAKIGSTYHRVIACAQSAKEVGHVTQAAKRIANPRQHDLLSLYSALKKACSESGHTGAHQSSVASVQVHKCLFCKMKNHSTEESSILKAYHAAGKPFE